MKYSKNILISGFLLSVGLFSNVQSKNIASNGSKEIILSQDASDTVNHKRPLPAVTLDTTFCNSLGKILAQAADSFKNIHDSDIVYDHMAFGDENGLPFYSKMNLAGSLTYANYIYCDSAKPCYFITTFQLMNDSIKAWEDFIKYSAQINQFLSQKTGANYRYRYDINQLSDDVTKTGRIWDANYVFTPNHIKNSAGKKYASTILSTQYIAYYGQEKMWYYISIKIQPK